ncbi:hypothetical protein C9374_011847 [Naegleria lovaniensis]|uniref:Uncharacterized protein n=1 Tax=Naegleria lovaniensis TaxID=51637 RepID=A0AA88KD08_NAELO|nr:uncharacterized protein C9374_011847 [Naegleria lovaniensis]KAG2373758.1 hypothetical protein C9374_011847 [Naegleria lovaniensis]
MEDHHQHTKKRTKHYPLPTIFSESKQKKIKTERKFELKTVAHAVLEKICAKIEQSNTPQYNPSQVTDLPKIHGSIMQKRLPDCWWASLGHKLAKKTTFFRYTLEVLSIELSDKQKINIEESSFFVSCKEYLTVLSDKTSEQTQKQQTMQDLADLLETKKKDWLENIVQRAFSPHTSQFCNDPSELAFCGPFVYPLFDFCALFDNCYRNRNVEINEQLMLSESQKHMKNAIRHKTDKYHHLLHPDLPKLVLMCRLAHSYCLRQLLHDNVEQWHNDIVTIGITTDKEKANVYALYSVIDDTMKTSIQVDYSTKFLGSFYHTNISHRVHLIALILTSMKNIYHKEMCQYLSTRSHISASAICSAQSQKQKRMVHFDQDIYSFIPDPTFKTVTRYDKEIMRGKQVFFKTTRAEEYWNATVAITMT